MKYLPIFIIFLSFDIVRSVYGCWSYRSSFWSQGGIEIGKAILLFQIMHLERAIMLICANLYLSTILNGALAKALELILKFQKHDS